MFGQGHMLYSGGSDEWYLCVWPVLMLLQKVNTHLDWKFLGAVNQGCLSDVDVSIFHRMPAF